MRKSSTVNLIGCDSMAISYKNYINSMDILYQHEKKYTDELESNPVKILRQIKVTKKEVDEIAKHISILFSYDKKSLQHRFPITVSLFLVWCTVYEYKDGDMWSNIFSKLKISSSWNNKSYLGDIFLSVLDKYELLQVPEGEGKKYLSPIIMHGYISDHYAFNLFDSLNRIYSTVLEEDTSEEAIEDIWDNVFNKDLELRNIQETIEVLKVKKKNIEHELEYYKDLDEDIKNLSQKDIEKLEEEVVQLEDEIETNRERIKINENRLKLHSYVNNMIEELSSRFCKACSKLDSVYDEDIRDINGLISEIGSIIEDKDMSLSSRNKELLKETKGLENKLAVKKETLLNYKTEIVRLGKGDLEQGWIEIERYHEFKKELEGVKLGLNKNEKYKKIAETEINTSLIQSLTASLNNLKLADPEHFKEFITTTLQMMGSYYTGEKVDITHPLYEIFIEWVNKEPINHEVIHKPRLTDYSSVGHQISKSDGRQTRVRLVLQTMKKPYIELDTSKHILKIVIPEQVFQFKQDIAHIPPSYKLIDEDHNVFELDIDYICHNQILFIKEKEIFLESTAYQYLQFQWYNLNESHDISLDEVMLFDQEGNFLNKNKLKNGYYYIVCNNSCSLDRKLIVDEYNLPVDGYKIYMVYLYETKAAIYDIDGDKLYELIATDYDNCYLINYSPVEGIYVDSLPVVTGFLPELFINYLSIEPTLIQLKIFLNDHLTYQTELSSLIEKIQPKRENSIYINIYKLLKFRYPVPTKFKIELSYKDSQLLNEEFFYLPKVQLRYTLDGLRVTISRGMRFSGTNYRQKGMEYIIPLKDKKGETFSIYYNMYGWVKVWVEVPSIDYKIVYKNGKEFTEGKILYGSKRELLKELFIQWESKSKRTKSILLFDNNHYIETRIYLKDGRARTSLDQYYDIFRGRDGGRLYFKIEDERVNFPEELILELYDKWEVTNMKVYQKEELDEYILGIEYGENFQLKETRYLEVTNDGKPIIYKTLKDQIYVYIKKKELISNRIKVNFIYYDEYEDIFFGQVREKIIAGTTEIKLKSKIDELEKIINKGILITGFEESGKHYNFMHPVHLKKIEKAESKNFEGEEMYKCCIQNNGILQEVYFYIDTERKVLPFLIDKDGDGAQYNPNNGRIFWEMSREKNIMGPLENIKYVIKEED